VGNVMFAIFPQESSVGVEDGGGIEVKAGKFLFVDRDNDGHLMPRGNFLHPADGRAVGDRFGQVIPAGILFRAEVGAIKQFLQTQDLDLLAGCLLYQLNVLPDHGFADLGKRVFGTKDIARLNQTTADDS